MTDRIFADDWRDCLREHYKHVIRQQDARTQATLEYVLTHELGFREDDLFVLRVEATRAESMPDDFVPEEVRPQAEVVAVVEADPTLFEGEAPALLEEIPVAEPEPEPDDDEATPDEPRQLSLF